MANSWTIYLRDGDTDAAVAAELVDAIEEPQLLDWRDHWKPALSEKLKEMGPGSFDDWPDDWHWNWENKQAKVEGLLAFRGFSIMSGGLTQGLVQVDLTKSAREPTDAGKPLAYIDYLETAPWNRPDLGYDPPRLRGVGTALLVAVCALSEEEGFGGRIGLHSLPQADDFYRKIGMVDLGEDAAAHNLRYFEMTKAHAVEFLKEE